MIIKTRRFTWMWAGLGTFTIATTVAAFLRRTTVRRGDAKRPAAVAGPAERRSLAGPRISTAESAAPTITRISTVPRSNGIGATAPARNRRSTASPTRRARAKSAGTSRSNTCFAGDEPLVFTEDADSTSATVAARSRRRQSSPARLRRLSGRRHSLVVQVRDAPRRHAPVASPTPARPGAGGPGWQGVTTENIGNI